MKIFATASFFVIFAITLGKLTEKVMKRKS